MPRDYTNRKRNAAERQLEIGAFLNCQPLSRRGYPDYMAMDKNGEILGFIEVKPKADEKLRKGQEAFKRLCQRYGIPFFKWSPGEEIPKFSGYEKTGRAKE